MTLLSRSHRIGAAWLVVGALCVHTAPALANDGKKMVLVAAEDAKFVPTDPAQPQGSQMAVLRGDPAVGPSAMLLKFKRRTGVMHIHTSDYHLIVLKGTMKHLVPGENEATAKPLRPGSFWFQPGGQPHADSCLSDECVMYINWSGKRDGWLAEQRPATR